MNFSVFNDLSWLEAPHSFARSGDLVVSERLYLFWTLNSWLQRSFDLEEPAQRNGYLLWWLKSGRREFHCDPFLAPDAYEYWRGQVNEVESLQDLPVTRLAYLLWWGRKDVQRSYPLSTPECCERFVDWYMDWGVKTARLPLRMALAPNYWEEPSSAPGLTRLQLLLWEKYDDLRQRFDINTPEGHDSYLAWFAENGDAVVDALPEQRPAISPKPRTIPAGEFERGGLNVVGFVRGELGVGEDVRMAAASLRAAGMDFALVDAPIHSASRSEDDRAAEHLAQAPRYLANLFYLPCVETTRLFMVHGPECFLGRYNIAGWQWELPRWPRPLEPAFKLVQEVWSSSNFTAHAAAEVSPVPVRVMPMAVTVDETPDYGRDYYGLPQNRFCFAFVFDSLSKYARKNPFGLLDAFKLAFERTRDDVALVVKAMNANGDDPVWKAFMAQAELDQRIKVINAVYSRAEILGLFNCCDAVVSLHRSEGFGRTLAEAMLLGKPVVASNYSGNVDFTTPETAFMVEGRTVPVEPWEYHFWQDQVWFDPDMGHAAEQMRACVDQPALAARLAEAGKRTIQDMYNPLTVGRNYQRRLAELGLI
ncbi:glycosyltransferase family 4 protein [Oceanidesulfovibrio marinus]|uniref:Glycosyltransferase family 4 protein n=1 Tax=Oceanidesulfovibrio marinus TaxID=370038 RepID=A0ABX6NJD7_9BACT|nr:glycosyltransferase family 4 protein [Oceanidesulfovibrio marinus]QJT09800.1 glycosyltransferase family 4 protein [Oceanidesulfovibrio marinus]